MLEEHLGYIADSIRLEQFKKAIAETIKPNDRVVDLGCGSGVLGLLCLQAGTAQVIAIDSTAMLEVARKTFKQAGFADRSVFIRNHSSRVTLTEPVDGVICDHVGYFGFDYDILATLQDARRRFLKPNGYLIPARLRLYIAAIESESCYTKAEGWQAEHIPAEFHWIRHHGINAKHAVELSSDDLLCVPAELADIDLSADNPEFYSWTSELHIERDGVLHGLAGWFNCELAQGVWMTNSPLSDQRIDRAQAFLPIDRALAVQAGELLKIRIMARPAHNIIAWVVECPASGQKFSHSTWQGLLLTREDLVRTQPDRVPHLNHLGKARNIVLGYCDGQRTIQEIEQAVLREHPDMFPSTDEISRFVAQALGRDTE